ncbi:putative protein DUF1206 [Leeuwenhoekiella aestuarii]|uniref:DUF1206 domain-containing protein n=1 Tax=Leeuwenhoekiella aestuarii TaxID=2249426 RepID=A0A4Q0NZW3_9FLAO|nr:DUF1206 domain-containing protein [Leeuwenhoekiella aestuarii]RXG18523.1 putative protein DUF1206 [Leeuwenhoekiella aestuarii]RXG19828.1 putative protein DUF1206 [Leeuwenhoekiella aestuarii]
MSNKKEKFARAGMVAKGAVYAIIGVLTAMAAFNLGGSKSGSDNVLQFLAQQSYGKVLLGALAIGLFGYTFYRIYEAINGPGDSWSEPKGFVKRAGYIVSGIFYGILGFTAAKMVLGNSSGSGGGDSMIATLMSKPYGPYLVGFVALCLAGKAIFQLYKAYSGKFRDDVQETNLSSKEQKTLIRAGKIGFTARGIVSGIVAFLFFKVALGEGGDTGGKVAAFEFLQNNFGATVMGIVALGLVAYAVFMFIQAKYAQIRL